jgi:hypothetical protein
MGIIEISPKTIIIIVVIIVVIILAVILVRAYNKKQREKKLNDILNNNIATGNYAGIPTPVIADLGTKAKQIWDAFYDNDITSWFGTSFTEDEEKAIAAINDVPDSLMPKLADIYYEMDGQNLKADCIKYIDEPDDFKRIENKLKFI